MHLLPVALRILQIGGGGAVAMVMQRADGIAGRLQLVVARIDCGRVLEMEVPWTGSTAWSKLPPVGRRSRPWRGSPANPTRRRLGEAPSLWLLPNTKQGRKSQ